MAKNAKQKSVFDVSSIIPTNEPIVKEEKVVEPPVVKEKPVVEVIKEKPKQTPTKPKKAVKTPEKTSVFDEIIEDKKGRENRDERVQLRMKPSVKKKLQELSKKTGLSCSDIVEALILKVEEE